MTETQTLLHRVQEECRAVGSKVRDSARRAVRQGVLRVDLVSLRRDRGRALADLGERVLRLWSMDGLSTLETDAEANRLRELVLSIEDQIVVKEAEAAALRQARPEPAPEPPVDAPAEHSNQ
jgi:hypothetical protein